MKKAWAAGRVRVSRGWVSYEVKSHAGVGERRAKVTERRDQRWIWVGLRLNDRHVCNGECECKSSFPLRRSMGPVGTMVKTKLSVNSRVW